jgi:hypothetical protein
MKEDRALELDSLGRRATNGLQSEPENHASRAHSGAHTSDGLRMVVEACERGEEQIPSRNLYVKSLMGNVSPRVRNHIYAMNWRLAKIKEPNESTFFITSDCPFVVRRRGKPS